jgi:hypothetical protein
MNWICILSSTRNFRKSEVQGESTLCRSCGSTWRARATALAVQQGLGYKIQRFRSIHFDWSRVGLGTENKPKSVFSRISNSSFQNLLMKDWRPKTLAETLLVMSRQMDCEQK